SRHESILRTHDDDRQVWTRLANAGDQIKSIFVRHDDVGDNQIAVALTDPSPQGCRVAGRPNLVAGAGKRLIEHRADRGIVVGNQNASSRHIVSHELGTGDAMSATFPSPL